MSRIELFGCPADVFTMEETVEWIGRRIERRQFTQHVVVNVAKLVSAQSDPQLAESVRACNIVNIDGMGVVWGAHLLGHMIPERVAGVDLFGRLLALSARRDLPVFLLGRSRRLSRKSRDGAPNRTVDCAPRVFITVISGTTSALLSSRFALRARACCSSHLHLHTRRTSSTAGVMNWASIL